jgi:hypothetical protein
VVIVKLTGHGTDDGTAGIGNGFVSEEISVELQSWATLTHCSVLPLGSIGWTSGRPQSRQ